VVAWGVDPSTTGIALAWCGTQVGARSAEIKGHPRGGERLSALWWATSNLSNRIIAEERSRCPSYVLVETPPGHLHANQLTYATGVIMAAIFNSIAVWNPMVVVEEVNISSWKAEIVGHGNATKEQVMDWALTHRFEGNTQDEADAHAIAHLALSRCRRVAA
jgi:hypothetical protein